ncbi:uncharacterized protein LOC6031081 isoform X8 [Culex quinquefasciatus]|nr:uncharacterized protein LOC6031081 isoform X8 [Culex quinquefasciatus]XP_038114956.1 uncharacterized protein LOC6031081 isoform X8 [Culex quinquefasciatus]
MGKCVSKQPVAGLNEFGSSPYLAICNEDDIIYINVGQSESKKSSKKAAAAAAGLETKGTAMSFGFMHKHKIHHASSKGTSTTQGADGTGPGSGTGTTKKATAGTNGNLLYGGGGDLEKEKATERDNATVISNPGVDGIFSDKNGNMGLASDDKSSATGRSTPRLQPPKKDSHGAPYRNNRFGFRSTNVVRPASVGLQPKTIADCDKQHSNNNNNYNNNNNIHTTNNNNVYITDKRRSKSASAAASARTTFTPVHQQAPSSQDRHYGALPKPQPKYHQSSAANGSAPKITPSEPTSASSTTTTAKGTQQVMAKCDQAEHKNTQHNPPSPSSASASAQFGNGSVDEHRPQSSVNNANGQRQSVSFGGHQQKHVAANSLTKSTQEASTVAAKFTLHSSSLPKPQYPVPISLPSTTVPAPSHYAMDSKGAKQAVNISRKGTLHQRDRSGDRQLDDDDTVDSSPNIHMPRQRLRNLEMVLSGRHKFEVRDLETLTAEPIEALSLPKLPSAFGSNGQQLQPVPLSGLVRSSELPRQLSDDIDINDNRYESEQMLDGEYGLERKDSITSSDVESLEEEKLMRDNNSSEKSLKGALIKDLGESHCSKTSSPGSSRASWCNAGETMAPKECSSLSLSSSDEDNLIRRAAAAAANNRKALREEEDISSITVTAGNPSLLSSLSAVVPMDMSTNLDSISEAQNSFTEQDLNTMSDEPDNMFRTEETKFAEMAAAVGDAILLDDETSPTDSLVSSCTESDDARKNRKKAAETKVEKEKEKDIDEISPELEELTSPVTPGTPTHASNSLSLSDNGRDFLIDDEIADQPALLFDEPAHNDSSMIDLASIHLNLNEDTPTLKDSISAANNNINRAASRSGAPVPKPRKIMSDVYESPAPIRKNRTRLSRAESLDTLSPCDSITSDDYMLDFNSSMDSINGPPRSNASGSASGLHSMDELQLWSELENKGQLMHEWSKLLRSQRNSNNNTSRESITSQLPARATRLLTRRLQNNATPTNCGSDSPRSMDSLPRRTAALSAAYKTVTLNQFNNNNNNNNINGSGFNSMTDSASTVSNSAEDLTLLDKSLRNSMLQDVVHFKKQLVRLRRILQEDEENLMMTDTLNPFENNNGQFFTTATATTNGTGNLVEGAATGGGGLGGPSSVDSKQQENTLIKESGVVALALLEDQRQELADLRRQVVYLQGEMTAKDRTIRQQQNLIEKYEAEREKAASAGATTNGGDAADKQSTIDTISTATQTERLRPLSFGGPEGLASRSEPPSPSHGPAVRNGLRSPATNHHHHHHPHHNGNSSPAATSLALATTTTPASPQRSAAFNLKPKTQISSVYTQLSSIKHSTHNGSSTATNGSTTTTMATMAHHKRSSLGASNGNLCSASSVVSTACNGGSSSPNKTVRTTHIGNVLTSSKLNQNGSNGATPSSPPPVNGTKLLKTSIRTQSSPRHHPATPKRTSAIKPPSSFGGTFPEASSKSKSAPATPMVERVPVQIVIDAAVDDDKEDTNNNENGHNGGGDDDAGEEGEHVAETELDAIHNKINSLKLANGLTGCNDSSCKESSLVN